MTWQCGGMELAALGSLAWTTLTWHDLADLALTWQCDGMDLAALCIRLMRTSLT